MGLGQPRRAVFGTGTPLALPQDVTIVADVRLELCDGDHRCL